MKKISSRQVMAFGWIASNGFDASGMGLSDTLKR